jgi:hypothetical protein
MVTVRHVTALAGPTKYRAAWFLLNRVYNRLPEDEASVSKHVEDIVKIKILI